MIRQRRALGYKVQRGRPNARNGENGIFWPENCGVGPGLDIEIAKKTIAISYPKTRAVAWHKTAQAKNIKVVPMDISVIATNIMVVSRNNTAIATSIIVVSPGIMAVTANMTVVSQNKGIR